GEPGAAVSGGGRIPNRHRRRQDGQLHRLDEKLLLDQRGEPPGDLDPRGLHARRPAGRPADRRPLSRRLRRAAARARVRARHRHVEAPPERVGIIAPIAAYYLPHHEEVFMKRDLHDPDLNSLLPDVQVDRRGFVAACIAAGFAVTAEPVLAQAIKTPMDGLDGGDVKIGDIPAYYAVPKDGGKRAVVLVVAEVFGLHEHIKDVVRRVAKEGYFAVANEPYFRQGELWKLEDLKQV